MEKQNFDGVFRHYQAQANGVRLHYVMGGQGEPILLLHGWPQTWYEWRKVMPLLAHRYTVIAPDLRGMGDSEKPQLGYDKRNVAEDIYQLVQLLGFEHIYLVGHDIGGMVAYAYASAYQNTVRRLAILDVLLPGFGLEEARASGFLWHHWFHMVLDIPEALTQGREELYLCALAYRRDPYNPQALSDEDIAEYLRCYAAPGGMRGGFSHYRTFVQDAEHNQQSAKTPLKMPVLALGGSHGAGDRVLQSMQPVCQNVRGKVLDRCGHLIAEEQPEELAQHLLSFFAEDQTQSSNAVGRIE